VRVYIREKCGALDSVSAASRLMMVVLPISGSGSGTVTAELPPAPDGSRVTLRQEGPTEARMEEWFGAALRLMSIPGNGPEGNEDRLAILQLIQQARKATAPLPDYEDVLRRYRVGAAYATGTTGQYLLEWIAERRRAADLPRRTLVAYEAHIRRHFLPSFGDKLRLQHVARAFDAIDQANNSLLAAKASEDPAVRATVAGRRPTGPATKQRIRATLRSALSDAAAQNRGLVAVNVAKLMRLEAGTRPKPRLWTSARVKAWETAYRKRLDALGPQAGVYERLAVWRPQRSARRRSWCGPPSRPVRSSTRSPTNACTRCSI